MTSISNHASVQREPDLKDEKPLPDSQLINRRLRLAHHTIVNHQWYKDNKGRFNIDLKNNRGPHSPLRSQCPTSHSNSINNVSQWTFEAKGEYTLQKLLVLLLAKQYGRPMFPELYKKQHVADLRFAKVLQAAFVPLANLAGTNS